MPSRIIRIFFVLSFSLIVLHTAPAAVKIELNNTQIDLDEHTGGILRMQHGGPGVIVQSDVDHAGMIDMAYPVEHFEPLRLANRFSTISAIEASENQVRILYDNIQPSRAWYHMDGRVCAEITIRAADDGKSLIFNCHLNNNAGCDIRQIVFPDFVGIEPFAGINQTCMRTAVGNTMPFVELQMPEQTTGFLYARSHRFYYPGSLITSRHNMVMRWFDIGSLKGGFSSFEKKWGWQEPAAVMLHLSQKTNKLRIAWIHDKTVKPGESWESGEYVITPHAHGWAEGIKPYQKWVKQNHTRHYPVPDRVRDGLGFRTVWMSGQYPAHPAEANFRIEDIPMLARESMEHGLTELCLWGFWQYFQLPMNAEPLPHLGTKEELIKAQKICDQIGIGFCPMVSVLQADEKSLSKYGLKSLDNNYTYHTEFLPIYKPSYGSIYRCAKIPVTNTLWRQEVLRSVENLIDIGITDICWDQFWNKSKDDNMLDLAATIRDKQRKVDPQSSFPAETMFNWELEARYFDYTWNWAQNDYTALVNLYREPRIQINIDKSIQHMKRAFMDNVYMNVFPTTPDGMDGTASLRDLPGFSNALKKCAYLRKQFLIYFTNGTLIGDCILRESADYVKVSAYVLDNKVLIIAMNEHNKTRTIDLFCDISPWLIKSYEKYHVTAYSENGKELYQKYIQDQCKLSIKTLIPFEMALFEIEVLDNR